MAKLGFELGFGEKSELAKDFFDLRFHCEMKKPCIPSEVVNEYKIIFEVLVRSNW